MKTLKNNIHKQPVTFMLSLLILWQCLFTFFSSLLLFH